MTVAGLPPMVPPQRGDGRNMLRPYGLTRTYPCQCKGVIALTPALSQGERGTLTRVGIGRAVGARLIAPREGACPAGRHE